MRAKLLKAFRILPWLLLAAVGSYLYFADGWKDLVLGRMLGKARLFFNNPFGNEPSISEVKIYSLTGAPGTTQQGTFPLLPYGKDASIPVYGSITISGDDLEKFMDCWRLQDVSIESGAMCHDPPYGFRLYSGDKLVKETSICWYCYNFVLPNGLFGPQFQGFNPDSRAAKKLLAFCDARLPYYRPPPKAVKTTAPVEPEAGR